MTRGHCHGIPICICIRIRRVQHERASSINIFGVVVQTERAAGGTICVGQTSAATALLEGRPANSHLFENDALLLLLWLFLLSFLRGEETCIFGDVLFVGRNQRTADWEFLRRKQLDAVDVMKIGICASGADLQGCWRGGFHCWSCTEDGELPRGSRETALAWKVLLWMDSVRIAATNAIVVQESCFGVGYGRIREPENILSWFLLCCCCSCTPSFRLLPERSTKERKLFLRHILAVLAVCDE